MTMFSFLEKVCSKEQYIQSFSSIYSRICPDLTVRELELLKQAVSSVYEDYIVLAKEAYLAVFTEEEIMQLSELYSQYPMLAKMPQISEYISNNSEEIGRKILEELHRIM